MPIDLGGSCVDDAALVIMRYQVGVFAIPHRPNGRARAEWLTASPAIALASRPNTLL